MLKMVSQTAKWRSCLSQAVWAPKGASKDPRKINSDGSPDKVTKRTDSTPNRTASRAIRALPVWSRPCVCAGPWSQSRDPNNTGEFCVGLVLEDPLQQQHIHVRLPLRRENEALKQLGVRTARRGDNVDRIAAMVRAALVTSQSTPRVPAVPPKESKEKICK
jgi:hypothetical protein